MKKALFFVFSIMLCIALFCSGCSQSPEKVEARSESCRVLCVMDDGFVVWIEDIGNVYVKQFAAGVKISPLGTVVMEFYDCDLVSDNGTFTDPFGKEQNYSYILENPKSIRLPTENEPTFG